MLQEPFSIISTFFYSSIFNHPKFCSQVLIAFAMVALAAAAPQEAAQPVYILKQDADITPDGYSFE